MSDDCICLSQQLPAAHPFSPQRIFVSPPLRQLAARRSGAHFEAGRRAAAPPRTCRFRGPAKPDTASMPAAWRAACGDGGVDVFLL